MPEAKQYQGWVKVNKSTWLVRRLLKVSCNKTFLPNLFAEQVYDTEHRIK